MLVLAVVIGSCMVGCHRVQAWMTRPDPHHVQRGLFGTHAREEAILHAAREVVEAAERVERLHHFRSVLKDCAWAGALVTIERTRGNWSSWEFGDGERWHVEQSRVERHRRRVVVGAAGDSCGSLLVQAYEPRGVDVDVTISDVLPGS